jgi:hypothetical protein
MFITISPHLFGLIGPVMRRFVVRVALPHEVTR